MFMDSNATGRYLCYTLINVLNKDNVYSIIKYNLFW